MPNAPFTADDNTLGPSLLGREFVLVQFHAVWCGPCKAFAPIVAAVAAGLQETNVVRVDIDRAPQATRQYGVSGVPLLVLFRGGKEVWRQPGLQTASAVKAAIAPFGAR